MTCGSTPIRSPRFSSVWAKPASWARLAEAATRYATAAAGLGFDAKSAAVTLFEAFLAIESPERKQP